MTTAFAFLSRAEALASCDALGERCASSTSVQSDVRQRYGAEGQDSHLHSPSVEGHLALEDFRAKTGGLEESVL